MQEIGERFVIDPGSLHHKQDLRDCAVEVFDRPLHQGLVMLRMVIKDFGFGLAGGAISQPEAVQFILADINTDNVHNFLSTCLVHAASLPPGGTWIPFSMFEKLRNGP